MALLIDVILVIIIGAIALIAALLIPSKDQIKENETARYKSGKGFIYIAGICAIFIGILLVILFAVNKDYQDMMNIPKMVLFMIIGITLITVNIKKSKLLETYEGAAASSVVVASELGPGVVMPGVAVTQPVVQPQIQAQVVQPVSVQPQVQTVQQVQVQPQVAVQPQPTAAAQPKMVVIKCPKCQGAMQINTSMLHQKMKCPHCGVEGRIG